MIRRREKGIWQRSFWQHHIKDQADYDLHEHLIIHAPVTEGLVDRPMDWALSSLHTRGVGYRMQKPVMRPSVVARPTADALF